MTKNTRHIIINFFIISFLFLLIGGCSNDISKLNYELQKFDRTEICNRRLTMYYGELDFIAIGIQESIYNEQLALEIPKKIVKDIKVIEDKFQKITNKPIQVHIIGASLNNNLNFIGGNVVYCTLDEFQSGAYREALVRACYNLTEPAIIIGLTEVIFGEPKDDENLISYYNNTEDMSILGLFGGRFYEGWNTPDEIQIAKDTATSLIKYLVENNGSDYVLSQEIASDNKREWLNSLGIKREYQNDYEGEFDHLTYSDSHKYSLIIKSMDASYNMVPLELVENASELENFLHKDFEGRKYILNYLKEEAPINFNFIYAKVKPDYYFSSSQTTNGSISMPGGRIVLGLNPAAHLHEFTHIITNLSNSNGKYWMQEGFAEYLSIVAYPDNYIVEVDFEGLKSDNLPESPEYWKVAAEYYKNHDGSFDKENINRRLYIDAYAYATLETEGTWRMGYKPISEIYKTAVGSTPEGNEISYIQACSFSAYLIENYTLEKYLGFYIGEEKNLKFVDVFGITYDEAKEKWLTYLYQ